MPDSVGAIVLAAGQGTRAGGPKQFEVLAGVPLFIHATRTLAASGLVDQIVVVVPDDLSATTEAPRALDAAGLASRCRLARGGRRRQDSVLNGLRALAPCEWVVVHDSARPFLDCEMIEAGLRSALSTGASSIATPLVDTLKQAGEDMIVTRTISREGLWTVQTPQVFRRSLLEQAHARITEDVTDDCAMVEKIGGRVMLYPGPVKNIKITTAADFLLAELLLTT